MPHDDDATRAAAQDIRIALDSQADGPVGHGQIRLGGEIVARSGQPQEPAAAPEPESAGSGPVGHGTIRLGGRIVAHSPPPAPPAPPAPTPVPDAVAPASGPVGHGIIRLGRQAESGPDDALESARGAIFAALSGSPTSGAA